MVKKLPRLLSFLLPAIPFLALVAFTASIVFKEGYIYHTDVTESLDVSRLYQRYIYTYSNDLGESLAEKARIPIFFVIYGFFRAAKLFGADDSFYVKLKILSLLVISYSFFVVYLIKLFKLLSKNNEQTTKPNLGYIVSANIAGLCYVTNFWFVNRIMHFGLFFATALLPIVFYYLYKFFFYNGSSRDLVKLLLFSAVFSATPHTLLMTGLIGTVLCFVYLATSSQGVKPKIIKLALLGVYQILFLAINSYWLLPYFTSLSKPDAVLSETIVNLLAKYASIPNGINLTGYRLTVPTTYFNQTYALPSQILSYIPALFLLIFAFLLRKNRALSLAVVVTTLFSIFLATSSPISDKMYFYLMFHSPIKAWGWLFREYDKFEIVTAFCFSLGIGFVLLKGWKKTFFFASAFLTTLAYLCVNFYFYAKTVEEKYTPVVVPQEFTQVVNLLNKDKEDFNTAWYPGVARPYWAKNEEVRYVFSNLISPKPAITSRSEFINYLNYLFNIENIYGVDTGKSLDTLGVKYLIIRRDDRLFEKNTVAEDLEIQDSLEKVLATSNLTVFKNKAFSGVAKYATERLSTNLGLETLKYLDKVEAATQHTLIDYSDKPSGTELNPTVYLVANDQLLDIALQKYSSQFISPYQYTYKKEDGNPGYWKLGSLENINHAETDFFFTNLGLAIPQFDYSKGVVITRDGWEKRAGFKEKDARRLAVSFADFPNITLTKNGYRYTARESDFKYYWDIVRSTQIPVNGTDALLLKLKPKIDDTLIPHFKIYSYNTNHELLAVESIYPDEKNTVNTIIKLPKDTASIDFSIWTLSYPKQGETVLYSYEVQDFTLEDITGQVVSPSLTFSQKSPCTQNCWLYARVLKSKLGKTLEIDVNSKPYFIDTNTHETDETPVPERYEWVDLGNIDQIGDKATIKLVNLAGFNSVNVLALLTNNQHNKVQETIKTVPVEKNFAVNSPQQSFMTTTMLNPTLYKLNILGTTAKPGVLIFAKPYSKNWKLSTTNQEPVIANGYVNGWYLDELKAGTYYIEYKPQKFFYAGVILSTLTMLAGLTYLIVMREVKESDFSSTSQG